MDVGFTAIGKTLVSVGIVLIAVGGLFWLLGRFPSLRIGRLPGDILIKRENFTFYFPLGTCIVMSLVISLVWWLIASARR
jgi:hypothetical protein